MPAWSPTRSAWRRCSSIPSPACCRPTASGFRPCFASRQQALLKPLAEELLARNRRSRRRRCADASSKSLPRKASPKARCLAKPVLHVRYDGTDTALPVNFEHGSIAEAKRRFEAAHRAQFGFVYDNKPLVVEAVGVEGTDTGSKGRDEIERRSRTSPQGPPRSERCSLTEAGSTPACSVARR